MTQREAVHMLDGGRCAMCRRRHSVTASSWVWQAHHVVKQQTLKRRGVRPARIRDATFCILLCTQPCHERQTSHFAKVPLEKLPARVVMAVDALGPWAEDHLRREHPPTVAGRLPANEGSP